VWVVVGEAEEAASAPASRRGSILPSWADRLLGDYEKAPRCAPVLTSPSSLYVKEID